MTAIILSLKAGASVGRILCRDVFSIDGRINAAVGMEAQITLFVLSGISELAVSLCVKCNFYLSKH